ncbi:hypothetical protein DOTSEDRAFT_92098 [Dothistroma septosporum NZE10]|uniref:Uncharacterized protein n=1 Tax=Dothistroma septosporum (strain NZE10 / CBS 128990) TaxID=675120 RepID=M2Y0D4_DOTSN|nr:hypothetical protein DOTSEDRAFT_92098 [Dothistroma septosporum NZE10]
MRTNEPHWRTRFTATAAGKPGFSCRAPPHIAGTANDIHPSLRSQSYTARNSSHFWQHLCKLSQDQRQGCGRVQVLDGRGGYDIDASSRARSFYQVNRSNFG